MRRHGFYSQLCYQGRSTPPLFKQNCPSYTSEILVPAEPLSLDLQIEHVKILQHIINLNHSVRRDKLRTGFPRCHCKGMTPA